MAKTALVVDDSSSMRQMVSFTLRQAGFEIVEGVNGRDALGRAEGKHLDLVVTDLNMPELDGIGLIRQLRGKAEFRFTPILMLTTESQDSKKQEGKSAGATGWIVKPFQPEKLISVIHRVVH